MEIMLHRYYFLKCINKLPIHLPVFQPFTSLTVSTTSLKLRSLNTGLLPHTKYNFTQLPTFSPLPTSPDVIRSWATFPRDTQLDDHGWWKGKKKKTASTLLPSVQRLRRSWNLHPRPSRHRDASKLISLGKERRLFTQGQSNILEDAWHLCRTPL